MNTTFLITGGNIGNRKKNLEEAADYIEKMIGQIIKRSSIYETDAWGNTQQPSFYNQVHEVITYLDAEKIMQLILEIEIKMGRIRTVKNAARIVDIDILFFNDEIINTGDIIIPHKEIANRRFVLMPLNEIASNYIHPVIRKNMRELLLECSDPLNVSVLSTNNQGDNF